MNSIPIISKISHELITDDNSLFHLPYPLPKAKDNSTPFESRKKWKKKQKKSLVSFLTRKK